MLDGLLPLALQSGGNLAKLLYLIPIIFWCGAAMWVLWDSLQRAGEWGWVWGVLAFGAAPVILPLYLVCIVIADRPAPEWVQREKELQKAEVTRFKAMGELERVKYLEAAAGNGGTVYAGSGGMQPHDRGIKQFSDSHAEQLIAAKQHDAAFVYLYDMYTMAQGDNDSRGAETYRYYIAQLPEGLALLKRAHDKHLSPAQIKVGGIKLLDAWAQPPDRSRTELPGDSALAADPAAPASADSSGMSLEQLLRETETAPPENPANRPLAVKAARDPRAAKRPEVPF